MASRSLAIRTPLVRALLRVVRDAGGDVAAAIERHSLPRTVESLADVTVPLRVLHRLSDEAATAAGDPFLGLHLAGVLGRGELGLAEFIFRNASTVREACRLCVRYSALVNDVTEVSLDERGEEAIVNERIPGEPLCGGCHSNEFVIALLVRGVREICGQDWRPRRIWFAHPRFGDRSPLLAFFGTDRISFGAGSNGIAFDACDLDRRITTSDRALFSVLVTHADFVVAQQPAKGDTMVQIRERVRLALRVGSPMIDEIAMALAMSQRTLQRRLAEEGTHFNAVVDEVREVQAKVHVGDLRLSLLEIALELGYSDLRAFGRAFKRWTGTTPGAYRRNQLQVA